VAQELKRAGWTRARALIGGWEEWQRAGMPVEAKPEVEV
jgi:3-mercaptopyruvate sulfurtransferase SseA